MRRIVARKRKRRMRMRMKVIDSMLHGGTNRLFPIAGIVVVHVESRRSFTHVGLLMRLGVMSELVYCAYTGHLLMARHEH